jgi:C_GCAxxG_C_C family probable redox protein
MDHEAEARRLFLEGYNCAQAVFCAFCDMTGMDIDAAARLSSSFGGGMGRLREVCGTVSGALLALGMLRGYGNPKDPEQKKAHYALVQEYARRFREKNGTIICRELLKNVPVTPGGVPEERTPEFYARRPCLRLAGEAAAILDEMLAETKADKKSSEFRVQIRS